jgi:hypothetical protein
MERARRAAYDEGAQGDNDMPSYFIDRRAQADGTHVVHDRSNCPPDCFPAARDAEYLGELLDGFQAVALARLNYAQVNGCLWCATEVHELGTEAEAAWPVARGAIGQGGAAGRLMFAGLA